MKVNIRIDGGEVAIPKEVEGSLVEAGQLLVRVAQWMKEENDGASASTVVAGSVRDYRDNMVASWAIEIEA